MSVTPRTFVGFGFGPIQAGLFLYEAFRAGNFDAWWWPKSPPGWWMPSGGRGRLHAEYRRRLRGSDRQDHQREVLNPTVPADAAALARALADARRSAPRFPALRFHQGQPLHSGPASLGAPAKLADTSLPACVVYAAENHNHAAELLQEACEAGLTPRNAAGRGSGCSSSTRSSAK